MPRDLTQGESAKRAKARRAHALERRELGQPTTPRISPAGPTSMSIKIQDPATVAMVENFLASRGTK